MTRPLPETISYHRAVSITPDRFLLTEPALIRVVDRREVEETVAQLLPDRQDRAPMARTDPRIADAYREMATEARYRPAAPSDGFGNITVPVEDLDLDAEAAKYAEHWSEEEGAGAFFVGSPDFTTTKALVYTIEAARLLCAVDTDRAGTLLQMALKEIDGS